MFLYTLKIRALTTKTGRRAWKLWGRLTRPQRHTKTVLDLVREEVRGKSFVDIGCMWGVDGEYSFVAEQSGARSVIGVDVIAPTAAFERKRRELGSNIRFIQGDGVSPEVMEKIGQVDVVLCAGVLYHHPSPYHMLVSLRELCRETLILASATIPESGALRQAAVYYPLLPEKDRRLWDVGRSHHGGKRWAINIPYDPAVGYSNWFWGMTPSCIKAMAETAGFSVEEVHMLHPFACVFLCRAIAKVPDELRSSDRDSGRARLRP
ncbi:MAG TPA: class I SAM-dependent methyltransferase [Blastocatellia bacterium]|nr:class I SAM-dependent methyltransferase [Blastocatellia bacterium]